MVPNLVQESVLEKPQIGKISKGGGMRITPWAPFSFEKSKL